jgi:acyl-CoA synthetase (NDP forming)
MNLDYVMKPKSMAIVGCTDKPGSFGRYASENALASAISDEVYFVHPVRKEIFGRPCYPSLSALPKPVECAQICTPAHKVIDILIEIGKLGIKGAVVYASGFIEDRSEEGHAMEKEMIRICHEYDITLIGPNCVGVANNLDQNYLWGLNLPFAQAHHARGAAVVAQSGSLIGGLSSKPNSNIAVAISTGNGNIVTLEAAMRYLVEDTRITAVMAYMEGIKDGLVFTDTLKKAAELHKPIIILKGGLSKKGAKSAASHTGNLAGDGAIFEAVLAKYGAIQADSMDEFICIAQIISILDGHYPTKKGVATVSFSGGESTVMADICERCGLELPDLHPETIAAIQAKLPSFATANNPLDATTALFSADAEFYDIFRAMGQDSSIGSIVLSMEVCGDSDARHECSMTVLKRYAAACDRTATIFVHPFYENTRNPEWRAELAEAGIPILTCGKSGLHALRKIIEYGQYHTKLHRLENFAHSSTPNQRPVKTLSESDSKKKLADFGIRVPAQVSATDTSSLLNVLSELRFPVVLKVDSKDIPHKTEAGGVILDVLDVESAVHAYQTIIANCTAYAPNAHLRGVLIQEMIPKGIEMILGVKNNTYLGPMILVGMGGVFTEVFNDTALYPCPICYEEALSMLKSLKSFRLLIGYRGSTSCDVNALCDMMVRVSEYAIENVETVAELDINPVFVLNKGAVAVDALVVEYQE